MGNFQIHAFFSNEQTLDELLNAGIDGIIIDWERKDKKQRQRLYNTQVNEHTEKDLSYVKSIFNGNIICRINGPRHFNEDEIKKAIDLGATEILVPMVSEIAQVDHILKVIDNQTRIGLMLETNESLQFVEEFNQMPIHRFFVGLNDLAIQRLQKNIFTPLIDGTIETLRPKVSKHFAVGGLTHPKKGMPIPCKTLIKLMKRHSCTFGILRRSFYADLQFYSAQEILSSLRREFESGQDSVIHLTQKEERSVFAASF